MLIHSLLSSKSGSSLGIKSYRHTKNGDLHIMSSFVSSGIILSRTFNFSKQQQICEVVFSMFGSLIQSPLYNRLGLVTYFSIFFLILFAVFQEKEQMLLSHIMRSSFPHLGKRLGSAYLEAQQINLTLEKLPL